MCDAKQVRRDTLIFRHSDNLNVLFPRRKTRDELNCYQEQCDAILKDVSAALEHLDSLQKQYLFVSEKTGTLHEACEQLLKEQVRCRPM